MVGRKEVLIPEEQLWEHEVKPGPKGETSYFWAPQDSSGLYWWGHGKGCSVLIWVGREKAPLLRMHWRREVGREKYIKRSVHLSDARCAGTSVQLPGAAGEEGSGRGWTPAGGGFERLEGQKLVLALCVHTKTSSINSLEIGLPFCSQTNGLFIKLKAAISIRKYSIPAVSQEG